LGELLPYNQQPTALYDAPGKRLTENEYIVPKGQLKALSYDRSTRTSDYTDAHYSRDAVTESLTVGRMIEDVPLPVGCPHRWRILGAKDRLRVNNAPCISRAAYFDGVTDDRDDAEVRLHGRRSVDLNQFARTGLYCELRAFDGTDNAENIASHNLRFAGFFFGFIGRRLWIRLR
jgi:hypothetical protein